MSKVQCHNGVCHVEVARVEWVALQPWQRSPQSKGTATAFVIDERRLLTNAHVVKGAICICVRPHGSTRRFLAKVVCYAPDVDLALLEIKGDLERADFFGHTKEKDDDTVKAQHPSAKRCRTTKALEFATELPALQETIHVVGFPTGGRTICVTEGVVSRIDLYNRTVAIQVDSAINPGSSGGPAFNSKGQVTGVAFRKKVMSSMAHKVDNIGYLIPAIVIRAFLGRVDATNGKYKLRGTIPYRCHSLENRSLRLAHKVPESIHGLLITSVADGGTGGDDDGDNGYSPLQLQPGDILTKIDDSDVADDGQVVLRGDEMISHAYLMSIKEKDEPVTFTVYRNGKLIVCNPYYLNYIQSIISLWAHVDHMPNFMILGSLVLLPAFSGMRIYPKCGHLLKADCTDSKDRWPREWEGKEGLVILAQIFAHELSIGYSRPWRRVVSYNGQKIKCIQHLQDLWTATCDEAKDQKQKHNHKFVRLELENDDDIVFEVNAAIKAQKEVMVTHAISKPYNIIPRNPKYS